MPVYIDQLGNTVDIPILPPRIISLVPSQTELLFHLGLADRVVGITKFCVHPEEWFHGKPRIGGTKTVKMEAVSALQPSLILANKEENVKEQVEELMKHYPVWTSDVHDLESALDMIRKIGNITGTGEIAVGIIDRIIEGFAGLKNASQSFDSNLRCAYLIWRNPYMTTGGGTFIHDMLTRLGLQNVFGNLTRYPSITIEDLRNNNCQLLLLSSEPYPFKEIHIAELKEQLPGTTIMLVDGEMFSWYGSRLLQSPAYFKGLLKQIV